MLDDNNLNHSLLKKSQWAKQRKELLIPLKAYRLERHRFWSATTREEHYLALWYPQEASLEVRRETFKIMMQQSAQNPNANHLPMQWDLYTCYQVEDEIGKKLNQAIQEIPGFVQHLKAVKVALKKNITDYNREAPWYKFYRRRTLTLTWTFPFFWKKTKKAKEIDEQTQLYEYMRTLLRHSRSRPERPASVNQEGPVHPPAASVQPSFWEHLPNLFSSIQQRQPQLNKKLFNHVQKLLDFLNPFQTIAGLILQRVANIQQPLPQAPVPAEPQLPPGAAPQLQPAAAIVVGNPANNIDLAIQQAVDASSNSVQHRHPAAAVSIARDASYSNPVDIDEGNGSHPNPSPSAADPFRLVRIKIYEFKERLAITDTLRGVPHRSILCQLLGVAKEASDDDLKQACRDLFLVFHPDKLQISNDDILLKDASACFEALNQRVRLWRTGEEPADESLEQDISPWFYDWFMQEMDRQAEEGRLFWQKKNEEQEQREAQRVVEEQQRAAQRAAEEQQRAAQRAAEEQQRAAQRAAEEQQRSAQRAAEEQQRAAQRAAEEQQRSQIMHQTATIRDQILMGIAELSDRRIKTDQTVAGVNQTVAGVNQTVAGVNQTVAGVNQTVAGVNQSVGKMQQDILSIRQDMALILSQLPARSRAASLNCDQSDMGTTSGTTTTSNASSFTSSTASSLSSSSTNPSTAILSTPILNGFNPLRQTPPPMPLPQAAAAGRDDRDSPSKVPSPIPTPPTTTVSTVVVSGRLSPTL